MPAIQRPGPATRCSCRKPGRSFVRSAISGSPTRFAPGATRLVSTPFGIIRPAPGRRTTGFASTICCYRRRRPTGSSAPASTSMCAAGRSPPTTCRSGSISRCNDRSAAKGQTDRSSSALEKAVQNVPGQLVIDAHADDVIVEAHLLVAREAGDRRRIEVRLVLQADVEIFHLRRPVGADLDLDAGARGPAPMPILFRDGSAGGRGDRVLDIGQCATGRGVEQPIVLGHADAAAEGRKPALSHLIAEAGIGRELERASLFARDRGVTLIADHDVAVLDLKPGGDAHDRAAEIESGRLVDAGGIVVN